MFRKFRVYGMINLFWRYFGAGVSVVTRSDIKPVQRDFFTQHHLYHSLRVTLVHVVHIFLGAL